MSYFPGFSGLEFGRNLGFRFREINMYLTSGLLTLTFNVSFGINFSLRFGLISGINSRAYSITALTSAFYLTSCCDA